MTNLQRKSTGIYRYRKVIPDDIRDQAGERTIHLVVAGVGTEVSLANQEIRVSLRTNNPAEAKARGHEVGLQVDTAFDRIRRGDTLSEADLPGLVMDYWEYANKIAYDSPTPRWKDELDEALEDFIRVSGLKLKGLDYERLRRAVAASLDEEGYGILPPRIEPVPPPVVAQLDGEQPQPQSNVKNLQWLYDLYAAERKPPEKTDHEWRLAIQRFVEINGDLPVTEIKKAHVREFKDSLLKMAVATPKLRGKTAKELIAAAEADPSLRRLSLGSVDKYLNAVKTIFNYGVYNDYLEANPAIGVRLAVKKKTVQRLPFTDDQLNKIFNSPMYTGCAGLTRRSWPGEHIYRDECYWLPLLGLWTGARLEELAQAYVTDVRQEDGIWLIDLNDLGEDQKIKNESSKRRVPLHKKLIEAGFLDYVTERRRAGAKWLFDLKPDRYGIRSTNWSKWFGRLLDRLGLSAPELVFHSFRHNFADACRNVPMKKSIHYALIGHTTNEVGEGYGRGYSIRVLKRAIDRIKYPVSVAGQ